VDGEIVALDDLGRPDFNLLQHTRSQASRICYFVFDQLVCQNRDLTQLPLVERREILRSNVKFQSPRILIAEYFETSAETMLQSAREQGLEGVVAKRKNSLYEAGKRSGAWAKFRLNSGQELVIGGYVPGAHGVESIIVGYYRASELIYVARIRNGLCRLREDKCSQRCGLSGSRKWNGRSRWKGCFSTGLKVPANKSMPQRPTLSTLHGGEHGIPGIRHRLQDWTSGASLVTATRNYRRVLL